MTDANSSLPGSLAVLEDRVADPSRSVRALLLMAPLVAFELAIFVIPFGILLRISLAEGSDDTVYAEGTWSLEAYADMVTNDVLWSVVGYSFKLGVVVTVVTVALALFYAYAIWRSSGLIETILLFSVVLPLLTTLVIRTYAFRPLLAPTGTLNEVLLSLNLIAEPIHVLPGFVAVVVGQTYIVLPYAVLSIYSVLATMDWHVVEAARDLGASRPRSVIEVVVPQAMPGIVVAAVISFAWSVGAYAAPGILSNAIAFSGRVEDLMIGNFEYPTAAALSVVMLALMAGSIVLIVVLLDRFGGEFDLA